MTVPQWKSGWQITKARLNAMVDQINANEIAIALKASLCSDLPEDVAGSAAVGVKSTASPCDHVHALGSGVVETSHLADGIFSSSNPADIADTPSVGSGSYLNRSSHVHRGVRRLIQGDGIELSPASGYGDVTVKATGLTGGTGWKPLLEFDRLITSNLISTYNEGFFIDMFGHVWAWYTVWSNYGTGSCQYYYMTQTVYLADLEGTTTAQWSSTYEYDGSGQFCVLGDRSPPGILRGDQPFAVNAENHLYGIFSYSTGYYKCIRDLGPLTDLHPYSPTMIYDGTDFDPEVLAVDSSNKVYASDGEDVAYIAGPSSATVYKVIQDRVYTMAIDAGKYVLHSALDSDWLGYLYYNPMIGDYQEKPLFTLWDDYSYKYYAEPIHTDPSDKTVKQLCHDNVSTMIVRKFNLPQYT